MKETDPAEVSPPEASPQTAESEKIPIGQFLGIEVSAPKGMKSPLMVLSFLILGNLLLLFLVSKAF